MNDDLESGELSVEPPGSPGSPESPESPEPDAKYRRGVAVVLALLAVLGAWIGILHSDAGTNESYYARETTRTAERALRATVNRAVVSGLEVDIDAEQGALALTSPFREDGTGLSGLGGVASGDETTVSPEVEALADIDRDALDRELTRESARLDLERTALAETRVTFNNRASQYETVLTTLGVALFLLGFTLVLHRRIRPPILVPGLLLVAYVAGWALWIHHREIPRTSNAAIAAAADGATAFASGRADRAVEHYDRAVDLDDDFVAAYTGRAQSGYVVANPDFARTLAVVDAEGPEAQAALADADRAVELGDGRDFRSLVASGAFRFFAGDYAGAIDRLAEADEVNSRSPEVDILLTSALLALGEDEAASAALDEALALLDTTQASAQNRQVAADLFTLLEFVEANVPAQAEAVDLLRSRLAAGETRLVVGEPSPEQVPTGAGVTLDRLDLEGDELTLGLSYDDLPEGTDVSLYLYEQPGEGAAFVQAPEMARFSVLAGTGTVEGSTSIERACTPVAFRLDVYLDGALAESFERPGGQASC